MDLSGAFTPLPDRHRFSTGWVHKALAEGWIRCDDTAITLKPDPPVEYKIVRNPGAFCLYCGEKVGDGPTRDPKVAKARVGYVKECQAYEGEDDHSRGFYEVADYYLGEKA
jgi:hypothetical protein